MDTICTDHNRVLVTHMTVSVMQYWKHTVVLWNTSPARHHPPHSTPDFTPYRTKMDFTPYTTKINPYKVVNKSYSQAFIVTATPTPAGILSTFLSDGRGQRSSQWSLGDSLEITIITIIKEHTVDLVACRFRELRVETTLKEELRRDLRF